MQVDARSKFGHGCGRMRGRGGDRGVKFVRGSISGKPRLFVGRLQIIFDRAKRDALLSQPPKNGAYVRKEKATDRRGH